MTAQSIGLIVWAVIVLVAYLLWLGTFFRSDERDHD